MGGRAQYSQEKGNENKREGLSKAKAKCTKHKT